MKYEQLAQVNESLTSIPVKGKEYVEVNARVDAFRQLYPNGAITTEIVALENGVCVIKATVSDDVGNVLATGTAYEKEGSTFINKTSYIENCETSAVGRALGFMGIGIKQSIASAEEVEIAIMNQEGMKPISEGHQKILRDLIFDTESDLDKFLEYYKVENLGQLTEKQYGIALNQLNAKKK